MFEVAGIDHVVLRTSKINEMLDFYCGILGCKVERESSPEFGITQLCAGCKSSKDMGQAGLKVKRDIPILASV